MLGWSQDQWSATVGLLKGADSVSLIVRVCWALYFLQVLSEGLVQETLIRASAWKSCIRCCLIATSEYNMESTFRSFTCFSRAEGLSYQVTGTASLINLATMCSSNQDLNVHITVSTICSRLETPERVAKPTTEKKCVLAKGWRLRVSPRDFHFIKWPFSELLVSWHGSQQWLVHLVGRKKKPF